MYSQLSRLKGRLDLRCVWASSTDLIGAGLETFIFASETAATTLG